MRKWEKYTPNLNFLKIRSWRYGVHLAQSTPIHLEILTACTQDTYSPTARCWSSLLRAWCSNNPPNPTSNPSACTNKQSGCLILIPGSDSAKTRLHAAFLPSPHHLPPSRLFTSTLACPTPNASVYTRHDSWQLFVTEKSFAKAGKLGRLGGYIPSMGG
jgi:hypothetical protein